MYRKGVVFYGSGGAYGFDMLAESAVLRAKQRHSEIKLILVLPCRDHDKYWTEKNKMQFAEILRKADKVVYSPLLQNVQRMLNRNFICQGGGGKHTGVW